MQLPPVVLDEEPTLPVVVLVAVATDAPEGAMQYE
jgi:hypothetical protein